MNDKRDNPEASAAQTPAEPAAPAKVVASDPAVESALDGIEDIDFLLEEIENKIAPLALA